MEFRDLKRQYEQLKTSIDINIENIILSTQFISGKAVIAIEEARAEHTVARYCISCGNRTDTTGATPVFVDVRKDTYNIDVESLESTIKRVIKEGELIPRVVVAVDLFRLPADYDAIRSICNKYNLLLLEDAAQEVVFIKVEKFVALEILLQHLFSGEAIGVLWRWRCNIYR